MPANTQITKLTTDRLTNTALGMKSRDLMWDDSKSYTSMLSNRQRTMLITRCESLPCLQIDHAYVIPTLIHDIELPVRPGQATRSLELVWWLWCQSANPVSI